VILAAATLGTEGARGPEATRTPPLLLPCELLWPLLRLPRFTLFYDGWGAPRFYGRRGFITFFFEWPKQTV